MKKLPSVRVIYMTIIATILVNIIFSFDYNVKQKDRVISSDTNILALRASIEKVDYAKENMTLNKNKKEKLVEVETTNAIVSDVLIEEEIIEPEIVFDGMTLEQLGEKLDRSLKSTLSGQGITIANYALAYDVDPYLAVAIILHETGCNSGKCSTLVRKCNNVGGMKGGPNCGNGSYKRFETLEEGIKSFMKNLSNNYIKKGLTTPEAMNRKYAESNTWAQKVKYYIKKVKNS